MCQSRKLKSISTRRKIDIIAGIRNIYFIESINSLCSVQNKTGYSVTKKVSIKKYQKMMSILDDLRLRKTKIDSQFLSKLYENILFYFSIENTNEEYEIDE